MTDTNLPRRLWYSDGREVHSVDEGILRSDPRSLVVLGEAGMGKSTLLKSLDGVTGYVRCTARGLVNAADARSRFAGAETLVIDALDEVPAHRDGDAVDLVVRKLGELGFPRFILACRVADWRSATALQGLSELYEAAPIQLHLEPLARDDAIAFLGRHLSEGRAIATTTSLEKQGLSGLWSNPQTLSMVGEVAQVSDLPKSKGQLFNEATKVLRREHREEKATDKLVLLAEDAVLGAAGAAFAALILTGSEAISTKAIVEDGDLPVSEVSTLPSGSVIGDILGSRLFSSVGPDRFTYAHRAIGEFLGARWLALHADTSRKRRRIRSLFDEEVLIPASLRGLHAWAGWHSSDLALGVMAADPMGFVEYADADSLDIGQAEALLDAFEVLSADHPRFLGWNQHRVGGIAQAALLPRLEALLRSPDTVFDLKRLILQAFSGSPLVSSLVDTFLAHLLDKSEAFATRSDAGELLAERELSLDWPDIVGSLVDQADENGVRLAFELIDNVGYDRFDDALLVRIVVAQLERVERTIGIFFAFERNVPAARLDALLDGIAAASMTVATHEGDDYEVSGAATDLLFALLARRLDHAPVSAERVATWLGSIAMHHGVDREAQQRVTNFLQDNTELRRGVQQHILLGRPSEDTLWTRSWRMHERSAGLALDEADLISLLETLPADDDRWRGVVELGRHQNGQGEQLRRAALRFVADEDAQAWLDQLSAPQPPADWEVKQEQRRRKRRADQEKRWAKHRTDFTRQIEAMRSGEYGVVVSPAKAYLKLFVDMGDESSDGPARIEEWLGPELREAALAGFEAFLTAEPLRPTAQDIAESYAAGKRWEAAYIIDAALAERFRTGRGFDDLSSERLMAGLFDIRHTRIDDHAGVAELDQVLSEALRERGCWEEVQRLYIEPQLAAQRTHIDGLYPFVRDSQDTALASKLTLEWLTRFPALPAEPEAELVDHLLSVPGERDSLRAIARARRAAGGLADERARTWDAVGLLIDFDQIAQELETGGRIDVDLLWSVRARMGGRRDEHFGIRLDASQLVWLFRQFRSRVPLVHRPVGVTSGDTNAWDASAFIVSLINRLGDDISDAAVIALAAMRDEPEDAYTELLRVASAEQKRKRVEARWRAPNFSTVRSVVSDAVPTTPTQLQLVVLEELDVVQRKLRGSDVDWYRDFADGNAPHGEERCRDALLKMMRPMPFGIHADPEGHLADDKRADIVCRLDDLMVPIEIKGQWHGDLWTSADRQLDRLYVNDWRAEAGIYVVLWFGKGTTKPLKRSPGRAADPDTPEDLRQALEAGSAVTQTGRVKVVVLDFERPH